MKISDKQVHCLLVLLRDSLKMDLIGYFSFPYDTRLEMLNEIINQQDQTPVEIDTAKEPA